MRVDRRAVLMLGGSVGFEMMTKKFIGPQKPQKTAGNPTRSWKSVYTLDSKRRPVSGSEVELARAIRRGADLRIYTEFRHNEHIDTDSRDDEPIQEVADFRVTYLLDDRWSAGIITLRQPIS